VRESQAFGCASTSLENDVTNTEHLLKIDGEQEINSPESIMEKICMKRLAAVKNLLRS
jgi:hypothetical protein